VFLSNLVKYTAKSDPAFAPTAREGCAGFPGAKTPTRSMDSAAIRLRKMNVTMTEKREVRGVRTTVCFREVLTADDPIAK
jgi:hypothetical protein